MASISHISGIPDREFPSNAPAPEDGADAAMTGDDGLQSVYLLNRRVADLRMLLDTAAEGFCSIDREGVITLCNASFLRMTGFQRSDQVVGKDLHQLIHHSRADGSPYPRADCPVLKTARTGIQAHVIDELFYRADGTSFPVEYWARPIVCENLIERAVCTFVDITERKQAEARQRLLNGELAHRIKNTLAVVQAIIGQTLRNHDVPEDSAQTINARLCALGHAHELLMHTRWESASITDVIRSGVAVHGSENPRIQVEGPRIDIGPNAALALTMALHELCTNAVKYGALSNDTGNVLLDWTLSGNAADARLHLRWKERGGPPVTAPTRTGFGSRIISEYCKFELGGDVTLTFQPDGLEWTLDAPLSSLKN